MKKHIVKVVASVVIIIWLVVWAFNLFGENQDPRQLAAQEAAQYLQERLELIGTINDHKEAIEQLKVREIELMWLENEAKKRSTDTASGYNYLETSF